MESRPLADAVRAGWTSPDRRTPFFHFDTARFRSVLDERVGPAAMRGFSLAYSIKTNPSRTALRTARQAGMLAEAINVAEVDAALAAGWDRDRIVLNGPAKMWPTGSVPDGLMAVMCDSVQEIRASLREPSRAGFLGLRLRPPGVASRFGVDLLDDRSRGELAAAVREVGSARRRFAVHVHQNSLADGVARWWRLIEPVIACMAEITHGSEVPIRCLDLGGGWDRAGLDELLFGDLGVKVMEKVGEILPDCDSVLLEPGHSVVADSGVVYTRVVGAERGRVTVDASVSELPFPLQSSRPIYRLGEGGEWMCLPRGDGTIEGRSCMETDVLALGADIHGLRPDDVLAFGDAGSYDTSFRTWFGTGREPVDGSFSTS